MNLIELWNVYSAPVGTLLGAAGGIYGTLLQGRVAARRDHLEAGRQALQLVARAGEREARTDALLTACMDRLDAAQKQRLDEMTHLQDVYAAAISARLIVLEMDARAGRPPRSFPPLPPYPYPRIERAASMDDATAPEAASPDTASSDAGGAKISGEEPDHAGGR